MREEIVYIKNFIQQERMLEDLLNELPLKQEEINLGFKKVLMPRLISWHGNKPYKYSGKTFMPSPWTENLSNIKTKVEEISGMEKKNRGMVFFFIKLLGAIGLYFVVI